MGLADNVFPVAWVPDDFGHSPQLPVLVEAFGMKAIGLSRIPGSIQPELCPNPQRRMSYYGITHNMTIGKRWYVQQGAPANRIGVWRDDGNIYQFGMEFIQGNGCVTGNFSLHSPLNSVGPATLLETGPIRWRFNATLNDTFGNLYSTQYDLQYQPNGGWSVVTSFPMRTADGRTATTLEYGPSYSWEDREPQKSWPGLTFPATHDFAQLVTTQAGAGVAALPRCITTAYPRGRSTRQRCTASYYTTRLGALGRQKERAAHTHSTIRWMSNRSSL
ncbi:hypothetical protein B0H14DRAFT_3439146 [Mycena olivaceomarginata]|nr:hypothetical protein B0H14DRAFT_3439146 [Mycena olivaceomarginata]